jgi:hypothetical protein
MIACELRAICGEASDEGSKGILEIALRTHHQPEITPSHQSPASTPPTPQTIMKNPIPTPAMRLLAACFTLCASAQAATFTVTTAADEFNTPSGSSLSLREAVRDAVASDTINFANGLSGQTLTLTGGEISVSSELTLDASALPGGVTIAGNGTARLLNIGASGNVTLVGLSFTGGNSGGGGGHLQCRRQFVANLALHLLRQHRFGRRGDPQ